MALTASLSFSGAVQRRTNKGLTGSLSFIGTFIRQMHVFTQLIVGGVLIGWRAASVKRAWTVGQVDKAWRSSAKRGKGWVLNHVDRAWRSGPPSR